MPDNDSITIVRARVRLTKLIHADGTIDDYGQAKMVDLRSWPLAGLDDLDDLLARLRHRPDLAVIRGAIADPSRTRRVRRLLHRDGDEEPTLIDVPRRWSATDVDGIDHPAAVDVRDIAACGEIAVAYLPPAFHRAMAIIQATSSHGFKPGIRLRLWHWLSRPVTGAELTYWCRSCPIDPATFRSVQLTYTSSPIFAAGAIDLLPARFAWRDGAPEVVVPPAHALRPPPRPAYRAAPLPPDRGTPGSGDAASIAVIRAVMRIQAAPVGRRNPTLFAAACSLAPLIRRQLLDESDVIVALTGAAQRAGIGGEPHRDAEREAKKAVAWAMGHAP